MKIRVGIAGVTGYTGSELLRILVNHPDVEITCITSETYQGKNISAVHHQFRGLIDQQCRPLDPELLVKETDLVFTALPHGRSCAVVPYLLEKGKKVIDLSADFRLKDPGLYERWYGWEHPAPELLKKAVYGIPELNRQTIGSADLVANPGCYPTSVILALAPLLRQNIIDSGTIIIDSKSGVSGAGRVPKQDYHFPECTENFKAYKVVGHQHTPEIEQELGIIAGEPLVISFTPHLVPMKRGILSTIYVKPKEVIEEKNLAELYTEAYRGEVFIRILEPPALPETRFVCGSNFCDLSFRVDKRSNNVILISAIDNLVKGASGQAVQNMNVLFQWPEHRGLKTPAFCP